MIDSPYRELTRPLLAFLDQLSSERPRDLITVVLPELVVEKWWEQLLHNQSALALKVRLRFRPNTVVVSVPLHLNPRYHEVAERRRRAAPRMPRCGCSPRAWRQRFQTRVALPHTICSRSSAGMPANSSSTRARESGQVHAGCG